MKAFRGFGLSPYTPGPPRPRKQSLFGLNLI